MAVISNSGAVVSGGTNADGSINWNALNAMNGLSPTVSNSNSGGRSQDTWTNLDIVNGISNSNTANSGYTYGTGGSASYAGTAQGQAIKNAIENALNNGQDITGFAQQFADGAQGYYNSQQPNPPKAYANSGFNLDTFMQGYMKYIQNAINEGKKSEQLLANQRMEQDLLAQNQSQRDAEKNYTDEINTINQGTYNASEDAKIRGMERGITYSAQQAGVEAGVASRAINNKQQAQQVRDLNLTTIKEKINAIKSGNLTELQSIEAKYNSQLQQALGDAYMKGSERGWNLSDMYTQRDWAVEDREDNQSHDTDMADLNNQYNNENREDQQTHDKEMAEINQRYAQDNMSLSQKYELQQLDVKNQYDQQIIAKNFENDLKRLGIEQSYAKELKNMDYAFQKEYLQLETQQKINLSKLEFGQQKVLMGMEEASKMRVLGAQQAYDNATMQAKFKAESDSMLREMVGSIITSDPNFTAYPTTDKQKLMMTDLFGVMSGNMSVDTFVRNNYSQSVVNNPTKYNNTVSIINNSINAKVKGWGSN